MMKNDKDISNAFITMLAVNKIKSQGMKPNEMREKLLLVAEKGDDAAFNAMIKSEFSNGLTNPATTQAYFECVNDSQANQQEQVQKILKDEEMDSKARIKVIVSSDALTIKASSNCKAELMEHIQKMSDEEVQVMFLALGSDTSFLDSLNKNDPSFSEKLGEMVGEMFIAGIDQTEILKEIEPQMHIGEIKKYIINGLNSEYDIFNEKVGIIIAETASEDTNSFMLDS